MSETRMPSTICSLALLLALSVFSGCDPGPPENEIDYSQEGPNGPGAQTDFTETSSGLKYRILREGTGKRPEPFNYVSVSYRGWLDNGTEFDSSYIRNEPSDFPLNGVIPGWTEGLQLVGEGGKIELTIPSELGYGPQGAGGAIPPNAQLHFIVELHEILK